MAGPRAGAAASDPADAATAVTSARDPSVATRAADDRARLVTDSAASTIALGERLGRLAAAGELLCLWGDLGAGKTQLAKGIARGLGIDRHRELADLRAHERIRRPAAAVPRGPLPPRRRGRCPRGWRDRRAPGGRLDRRRVAGPDGLRPAGGSAGRPDRRHGRRAPRHRRSWPAAPATVGTWRRPDEPRLDSAPRKRRSPVVDSRDWTPPPAASSSRRRRPRASSWGSRRGPRGERTVSNCCRRSGGCMARPTSAGRGSAG